jgi:hypothetical protein
MTTLRSRLDSLASSFASDVLRAIQGSSLEELLGEARNGKRGPGRPPRTQADAEVAAAPRARKVGRLARRTPEQIAKSVDLVSKLVKSHPKGMRAEEIRKALGLDAREMPRILKEGIATKKLTSKGQKRATTYLAK